MVPGRTDACHSAACDAVNVGQACTTSPAAAGAGECGQVLGRLRTRARYQGVRRRLLPQKGSGGDKKKKKKKKRKSDGKSASSSSSSSESDGEGGRRKKMKKAKTAE